MCRTVLNWFFTCSLPTVSYRTKFVAQVSNFWQVWYWSNFDCTRLPFHKFHTLKYLYVHLDILSFVRNNEVQLLFADVWIFSQVTQWKTFWELVDIYTCLDVQTFRRHVSAWHHGLSEIGIFTVHGCSLYLFASETCTVVFIVHVAWCSVQYVVYRYCTLHPSTCAETATYDFAKCVMNEPLIIHYPHTKKSGTANYRAGINMYSATRVL